MTAANSKSRFAEYPVQPYFIERWSPRSFIPEHIPQETLFSFFEAARWAPSGQNEQPWRFIYSKRQNPNWQDFIDLLSGNNRLWAHNASAIVIIVSKKTRTSKETGEETPSRSHTFDSGAAWYSFALQAHLSGWATHAIGGFDRDKARELLNVPENYHIEVAIAVGRQGEISSLPETLQAREAPNGRLPLDALVFENSFSA